MRHVRDVLSTLARLKADVTGGLPLSADEWTTRILNMIVDTFRDRASDVRVDWLRPGHSIDRLSAFAHAGEGDAEKHFEFGMGEGLAGFVWQTGESAASSRLRAHPRWVWRRGCENASYICVSVSPADRTAGVLAVGSDAGFEVSDDDVFVLELFRDLIAMCGLLAESGASATPDTGAPSWRRLLDEWLADQQSDGLEFFAHRDLAAVLQDEVAVENAVEGAFTTVRTGDHVSAVNLRLQISDYLRAHSKESSLSNSIADFRRDAAEYPQDFYSRAAELVAHPARQRRGTGSPITPAWLLEMVVPTLVP